MKQKLIAMMGSLLTACMAFSWWIGTDLPCLLFIGDYKYPTKDEI